MKKQILLTVLVAALGYGAQAQTTRTNTAAAATTGVSKEEKAKQKQQQEKDLNDALEGAGLSADQVRAVHTVIDAFNEEAKAVKANTSLTDAQREEARERISKEKNAKMKSMMGEAAYKKYSDIRKQQKERAANAG